MECLENTQFLKLKCHSPQLFLQVQHAFYLVLLRNQLSKKERNLCNKIHLSPTKLFLTPPYKTSSLFHTHPKSKPHCCNKNTFSLIPTLIHYVQTVPKETASRQDQKQHAQTQAKHQQLILYPPQENLPHWVAQSLLTSLTIFSLTIFITQLNRLFLSRFSDHPRSENLIGP